MLPIDLRAARKFTGHWSPYRLHTDVSPVNCVGITPKLKSTCQDQKMSVSHFFSIIYDNLYQYQPMMLPVAVDINKSDFSWFKVSRGLLLLFSSWNWSVQNYQKNLVNAHIYWAVIVVAKSYDSCVHVFWYLGYSLEICSGSTMLVKRRTPPPSRLSFRMDWGHLSASLR